MKCIGILGGSSDQATADYHRQLNLLARQRRGGFNTEEPVMTSMNFRIRRIPRAQREVGGNGAYLADRDRGRVMLQLGGAVVADSDHAAEWAETVAKGRCLAEALDRAPGCFFKSRRRGPRLVTGAMVSVFNARHYGLSSRA